MIGITLKRSSVRVPQYNINKTNNKIYYTVGSSSTEYIATINPGYYFVSVIVEFYCERDYEEVTYFYNNSENNIFSKSSGKFNHPITSSSVKSS